MKKPTQSWDIIETKETPSHKESSNAARTRKRKALRHSPVSFICVDGEGVTDKEGRHSYVLLGVGQNQIENPDGLTWKQIFEFLYDNFQSGGIAFCGYFLTYDFVQWLRNIPEHKARRLLKDQDKRKRKTPGDYSLFWPVDLNGWQFDILGMKRLKLRPAGEKRWMYICDAGSFFQMSFLKAIDPENHAKPICTQEEYNSIKRGKEARSDASLDADMRFYNRKENEICARLLGSLDQGFRQMGIHLSPKQWFGPGQAAQEWLNQHIEPSKVLLANVPSWFVDAARDSYFGGWFEIMAHGIIPGITHEYDINSAYPYIISNLPCLRHGRYSLGQGKPPAGLNYCLIYATVWTRKPGNDNGPRAYIGSMLHRQNQGRIYRPQVTEGWFWKHELDAAIRAGVVVPPRESQYREWVGYEPCSCDPPLKEVSDLYDLRQRTGKKTPLGIAAKLAYNSMYGKFAQSIGNPKFGNSIYASLITAGCRTQILNAIATHPEKAKACLMVATDGVYFTSPHPDLPISKTLGEWDYDTKSNICLFKPGVYWDDNTRERIRKGEAPVFKSRGISARDFASQIDRLDNQFRGICDTHILPNSEPEFELTQWPSVKFTTSFSMVTAISALHRGKWETAGEVSNNREFMQSSDPYMKRGAPYFDEEKGFIRTHIIPAYFDYEQWKETGNQWADWKSKPYEKKFGIDDPWNPVNMEEYGVTPDGLPGNLWMEMLKD